MTDLSHREPTVQPRFRWKPIKTLRLGLSIWHQRRHLAGLSDHLLRDIGLSRREANAEARRCVWDMRGIDRQ